MKKKEAYSTLGLNENASAEEVKKAFRSKAKELHPDVNKSPNAEKDFKLANEAYQAIEKDDFDDNRVNPFSGASNWSGSGSSIWDIMNGFGVNIGDFNVYGGGGNSTFRVIEDIHLRQTISFKDAILGCKKDLTYNCDVMCEKCRGMGNIILDNGCKTCNGRGRISGNRSNMFFERTCADCKGRIKTEQCKECSHTGKIKSSRTVSVSIQPGIVNNTTLRLSGMGNFSGQGLGNSTAYLVVNVSPDKDLWMEGNDVCTNLYLPLVDAIKGCTKEVHTIDGMKKVDVPAMSKNKNEVSIPNLGVNRQGNERVRLYVDYPKDVAKLIAFLEEDK